jgi:hypothetical protein
VIDGELKCVYRGCTAALGRLGQTDGLSDKERTAIRGFLFGQIARFSGDEDEAVDDSIVAPDQGRRPRRMAA